MKKVRIIILFMTLFLGMFFIMPAKVFASIWVDTRQWRDYISQFDFGFAKGEIDDEGIILIVEESGGQYEGDKISYYLEGNYDIYNYFAPELVILKQILLNGLSITLYLEENFEDYDGYLYWNFEQGYWQIESTELDYYKQMVEYLEEEIQQLENQIQQIELVENNDIDISKWFVPLVVIIIVVGIIEPIILCKRRG